MSTGARYTVGEDAPMNDAAGSETVKFYRYVYLEAS